MNKDITPRDRASGDATPAGTSYTLADRMMLDALLIHSEDAIYFKDRNCRFLRVSQAFAVRAGFNDASEMLGLTDHDIFTTEHAEQAARDEQEILRTGRPMIGKVEKETWADGHDSWASSTKLPFRGPDGEIIGTFGISRDITKQYLAEQEAHRVAKELKVRNKMYEGDLELASELFSNFAGQLPSRIPGIPGTGGHFLCASYYQPAASKLGGDFFIVEEQEDRVRLLVCDVMGHGVQSALVAVLMRTWAYQFIDECASPAEWLHRLNARLCSQFLETGNCFTATAFACDLNPASGRITYSSAGHPPPILRNGHGKAMPEIFDSSTQGPGLGMIADATYDTNTRQLVNRDCLLLYTDGLMEARNARGQELDIAGIMHSFSDGAGKHPDVSVALLKSAMLAHAGNHPQEDDVCILALEWADGKIPA